MLARKSFLKINNNRLVEYKYYNQRTLHIIINIFGEMKGWIRITGYDFEIILIIMLRLYRKMPILRNLEAILVGEKTFL